MAIGDTTSNSFSLGVVPTFTTQSQPTTTTEIQTSSVTNLLDSGISSSSYGANIPLLYGTMALKGNVIWSTGIVEVIRTTKTITTTKNSNNSLVI